MQQDSQTGNAPLPTEKKAEQSPTNSVKIMTKVARKPEGGNIAQAHCRDRPTQRPNAHANGLVDATFQIT
jgi:hypothetical protein